MCALLLKVRIKVIGNAKNNAQKYLASINGTKAQIIEYNNKIIIGKYNVLFFEAIFLNKQNKTNQNWKPIEKSIEITGILSKEMYNPILL